MVSTKPGTGQLSATTKPSLSPLRHAYRIAVLHLSDETPLNQARRNAAIALSALIHSQPTPEKIDKAKSAVEEWMHWCVAYESVDAAYACPIDRTGG
jgi:hypothetical protein